MIAIMWQFDVKNGRETEFEQLYGAEGAESFARKVGVGRALRHLPEQPIALGGEILPARERCERDLVVEMEMRDDVPGRPALEGRGEAPVAFGERAEERVQLVGLGAEVEGFLK